VQSPLQPLQDNLESTTYETFERDGQKYSQYQLAIAAALRDRVPDTDVAATEVHLEHRTYQYFIKLHLRAPGTPDGRRRHEGTLNIVT